jgi:hypothetical protein
MNALKEVSEKCREAPRYTSISAGAQAFSVFSGPNLPRAAAIQVHPAPSLKCVPEDKGTEREKIKTMVTVNREGVYYMGVRA